MESQAFREKLKLAAKEKRYQWKGNEQEQDGVLKARIDNAKSQRRQVLRRFDNLDFETDYRANEDAITAYLRPKKNDDEVRVNTGTTEKKVEIIINEMLGYNFQPEIFAFDKNDLEIQELGESTANLVTRTNEMENDEDLKTDALFEFVGQRAVFLEEYLEEKMVGKRLKRMCKKRLLSGLQVFLGDITLPHYRFQEQPFIVKYDKSNYWTAKMFYGHLKNWEFVMPGENIQDDWFGGDFNYRLARLDSMEVEIIRYESAVDREMQLWINGVPMYDFGTELPWKHDGYNIVMGTVKRLSSNLAYGKPITASLKYLQGFKDETVRNLIRKFRQGINPPKGVASTGKIYSKDIFEAGKVTYGIPKDAMHTLVDHNGLTQSDVAMLEMVNNIADEFASSSAIRQGIEPAQKETATAIIEQRRQAAKMLGLVVVNWVRLLRDLTFLRIYNIFENLVEPEGKELDQLTQEIKNVYQQFTQKDAQLSSGKIGTRVINFTDRNLNEDEEDQLLEMERMNEEKGTPVEMKFLNVKLLQNIQVIWRVIITPKEREDSALRQLMFADKFAQATELSVAIQEPLNPGKWKQEYEQTWKMKDAFAPQPMMPQVPGMMPQGMGEMGAQMAAGSKAEAKKPSMQAMLQA